MGSNLNGSGNGRDKDDKGNGAKEENIVDFPTLADRDRMRKEKIAKEEAWREEYKAKQKVLNKTDNPPFLNIGKIPLFVKIILPLIVLIHLGIEIGLNELQTMQTFQMLGLMPVYFSSMIGWNTFVTPITHMFIHGGWMHLAFNSIMLAALGTFCAREFGDKMTTFLFFLCGLGGALFYVAFNFDGRFPLIGASGATSGFFGILLIIMQKRGGFNQFGMVRKYGSLPIILFWLAFMIGVALLLGGQSWEAHIGGFITGLLWLSWIVRKDLKFWRI
ncbi:MAG: rhomboid family intramembrane serine protease [Alphaproteobacteria bacterium]